MRLRPRQDTSAPAVWGRPLRECCRSQTERVWTASEGEELPVEHRGSALAQGWWALTSSRVAVPAGYLEIARSEAIRALTHRPRSYPRHSAVGRNAGNILRRVCSCRSPRRLQPKPYLLYSKESGAR